MKRVRTAIAAAMFYLFLLPTGVQAAELLIPGGQIVGLQLENDTVTVAAFDDALGQNARKSGLQIGDELLTINGTPVRSAEDVRCCLDASEADVTLTIARKGRQHALRITPKLTDEGKKLGIYLKQGIAGIGTITWYDPQTHVFGTLGHGVNDGRGKLLRMTQGTAFHAQVMSIKKGTCGEPGQLKGSAETFRPWGTLLRNTAQGVFGTTTEPFSGKAIPIADYDEVHTGKASIRCAVENGSVQEYSVDIIKIYPQDRPDNRNFLLKVTDPALLAATGGIVQGMSGSPILQNGRIVGAVTHVLVNSPDTGYGIFIENMLEAAS